MVVQESNIILSNSFEYRLPSKAAEQKALENAKSTGGVAKADMTSRFVGLIVIPGNQIIKMEVEERRLPLPVRPRS
jgi:N-alpha-acetyltransferase 38, NatC auxiliary subunit